MRFSLSTLMFAASAAVVSAQFDQIPDCATTCFAAAIPTSGCQISDLVCLCTTGYGKVQQSVLDCVPTKCSPAEIAGLKGGVGDICASVGITPPDVSPSSGSESHTHGSTAADSSPTATQEDAPANTGVAGVLAVKWGAVALGFGLGMGL